MRRILVPNAGPTEANLRKALSLGIAAEDGIIPSLFLIVPSATYLGVPMIIDVLNQQTVNRLKNGQPAIPGECLSLRCGVLPEIASHREIPASVVVFHVFYERMPAIDVLPGVQTMIYVPWTEDDGSKWQAEWHAEIVTAS